VSARAAGQNENCWRDADDMARGNAFGYALSVGGQRLPDESGSRLKLTRLQMYCRYCGKEVMDKAIVCSGCGRPIDAPGDLRETADTRWSVTAMFGIIMTTLIIPPVGLVLGLRGLMDEHRKVQGAVLLTVFVFMTLLWAALILGL
jgi:hypothetical protein